MVDLWLDDERDPERHGHKGWSWVKTADDAIRILETCEVETASLDHNLGLWGTDADGKTGMDVCEWLEANPQHWPKYGVFVHSLSEESNWRMKEVLRRAREKYRAIPLPHALGNNDG